jgi:hypothetical protein
VDGHLRDLSPGPALPHSGQVRLGADRRRGPFRPRGADRRATARVADPTWTLAPSMNFTITTPFSVL